MTQPISRRTLLRGARGIALGLPLLEAMAPRSARAAEPPRRFLVWAQPNGTVLDRWVCKVGASERDFTLSEILAPLERHKADMIGLQNIRHHSGYGHQYATTLTGRPYMDTGYPNIFARGISLDQYIAQKWMGRTPVPSLQIGLAVAHDRETSSCLSWVDVKKGLPAENNPYALYNRLFTDGSIAGRQEVARLFSSRRSAIDSVLAATTSLARRVGQADRLVLENYLESVRAVEVQMTALEKRTAQCASPRLPADRTLPTDRRPYWLVQDNVPELMKIQTALITAIFACDLTRVITFTVAGSGGAHRGHPWLPEVPRGHDWHGHSHQVEKGVEAPLVAIDRWYMGQLALLVDQLKGAVEPNGRPLLASTLMLVTNEYGANGPIRFLPLRPGQTATNFSHHVSYVPTLLFGQAGGALRTGRYLSFPVTGEPQATSGGVHHNRLFVSILNALGIPDQTFGDPRAQQGPLPGLLG